MEEALGKITSVRGDKVGERLAVTVHLQRVEELRSHVQRKKVLKRSPRGQRVEGGGQRAD